MLLTRLVHRRPALAFWTLWLSMVATFAGLAVWSQLSSRLPFDKQPTFWLQHLDRYWWGDPLFDRVNHYGDFEVIAAVLAVSVIVLLARGLRVEALIMAGAGAMYYVHEAVRHLVHRPDGPEGLIDGNIYPGPAGYPSGHAFGELVVYGLIFAYIGRVIPFRPVVWVVRAACFAEITLGAAGRLYNGAHWPADVAGGSLLAAIYLMLAWRIDSGVARQRRIAAERALAAGAGLSTAQPVRADGPREPAPAPEPDTVEAMRAQAPSTMVT